MTELLTKKKSYKKEASPIKRSFIEINLFYKRGKHIPALDGIRGVAIIFVLLFHCYPYLSIFKFGWAGVDLFFVLSGFLITGILIDTVEKANYYKKFILNRIIRIFPLYYLSLFLFLFLLPRLNLKAFEVLDLNYSLANQGWYWLYISNWLLSLKSGWTHGAGINHFWSLSVEEQFYLFWPLFVYLFRKRNLLLLCGITIILSVLIRNILFISNTSHAALYLLTITRADALALGGIIAVLIRKKRGIKVLNRFTVPIFACSSLIIIAGICLSGSVNPYMNFFSTIGYTIIDLICASLIIFALSDFLIFKKFFSLSLIRFFGKYSYSMYIFHYPIVILCFYEADKFLSNNIINNLLVSTFSILITIIVSLITWYTFEGKLMRLKKRLK